MGKNWIPTRRGVKCTMKRKFNWVNQMKRLKKPWWIAWKKFWGMTMIPANKLPWLSHMGWRGTFLKNGYFLCKNYDFVIIFIIQYPTTFKNIISALTQWPEQTDGTSPIPPLIQALSSQSAWKQSGWEAHCNILIFYTLFHHTMYASKGSK